jgi:glycine oxidase
MTRIAIIGCGIVGAMIAYELSQLPEFQIVVIEKNTPASGSTGAALGVLMGAISHKKQGRAWQLRDFSLKRYETLIPELEAKTGINIPVNRQGILQLLFEGDNFDLVKWQKLQELRHSQGWHLEICDRTYVSRHYPHIDHDQIIGAVYSPQDRQINPFKLTEALVTAATQNGVKFQFGVGVEDFIIKSRSDSELSSCDQLRTTKGNIEVDKLIISAGLGSTPLTASLQQEILIRPVLGQALKLRLTDYLGQEDFQPVITGDDIHIVPLGNKEYWLGATVEFPLDTGESIAEPELLVKVKQKAIAFCPALKDATILETWSGKRPRPEGIPAPIIGKLSSYNNVLLATAHYRNGVLLAPATAWEITQMINN